MALLAPRRRRPWLALVTPLVLALLLTGCDVAIEGSGAVSGTAVTPDQETTFDLRRGSSLTVPEGGVSEPGLLTVVTVDPPARAPEGLAISGDVIMIDLRGAIVDGGLLLSLAAEPTGPSPKLAVLGRFDADRGGWQQVAASYTDEPARVTATLSEPGTYAALRVDVDTLADLSRRLLDRVLAPSVNAAPPQCEGDLVAGRITVEATDDLVVASCVGVREGAPDLSIVGGRGSIVTVEIPTRWNVERTGEADAALQATLDVVAAVPVRPRDATEGRTLLLLAPGLGLRLGIPPDRKATLRMSPDPRAVLATGIDYAADVMTTFTLKLPWIGAVPDPAATAALVRAAFANGPCATQLAEQSSQPSNTPEQIGRLFRSATGLGVRCLATGWATALGRPDPATDPLTATMVWVAEDVELIFTGPVVGPALDFPNQKIEVTQVAA